MIQLLLLKLLKQVRIIEIIILYQQQEKRINKLNYMYLRILVQKFLFVAVNQ